TGAREAREAHHWQSRRAAGPVGAYVQLEAVVGCDEKALETVGHWSAPLRERRRLEHYRIRASQRHCAAPICLRRRGTGRRVAGLAPILGFANRRHHCDNLPATAGDPNVPQAIEQAIEPYDQAAYATMLDLWQRGESPRSFKIEPIER